MGARIDVTHAGARAERDLPHPAGIGHGSGVGVGRHVVGPRHRHGDGAIVEQLVVPVDPRVLQRLLGEHAAEAGAIDEQVGGQPAVAADIDGGDRAVRRQFHTGDLPEQVRDALARGDLAQVEGQRPGIEVVGVGALLDDGRRAIERTWRPVRCREVLLHGEPGIVADIEPRLLAGEPVVKGVIASQPLPGHAEGVPVLVPRLDPVGEADGELVAARDAAHELGLVEAGGTHEAHHRRDGRLPHPDGADVGAFDQRDLHPLPAQHAGQIGGSDPAGRAATDDDDGADGLVHALALFAARRTRKATACSTSASGSASAAGMTRSASGRTRWRWMAMAGRVTAS